MFEQCASCHALQPGRKTMVGPHLGGIVGRKAGSLEDFGYSAAMKKAGADGLAWSADTLDAYLTRPRDFIKGNRMSFRGMADAEARNALIAWLAAQAIPRSGSVAALGEPDNLLPGFADVVIALEGDAELGQYLAGECVTCHQASGHADGIPSIVGLPRDYFIRAIFAYKTNVRSNEVMKIRTADLSNEDIAALAAYFSGLAPN